MKLSIIIPIYFHKIELYPIISKCLESIKKHYPNEELILIDDCSPLDTSDWPITYKKEKNTGFTNTVNEGLHRATGDILVIMNDDIYLKEGDLDLFKKITTVGIYSPKTTDEGEGDYFGSIWGMDRETYRIMGDLDEKFPHYFSDTEYYKKAKELNVPITKWHFLVVDHVGKVTYQGMESKEAQK